ncbi:MAG: acyl-CoA dehydrogenase [Hyphomicrobiaceae bacterium]|jgi:acyl-CoA dehydrogenase
MNFDFSDDQKMLKETAAAFLKDNAPLELCRSILESDESYSAKLWQQAAKLGWQATAIPEEYGGVGFGRLELAMIAEEVGASLAPIPFASSVYFATEALVTAGSEDQKKAWLPRLATGDAIGTFALAERSGQNGTENLSATFDGATLSGTKTPVFDGDIADFAIVAAADAAADGAADSAGVTLLVVDLNAGGVTRHKVESFDPSRSLATIEFAGVEATVLGERGAGAELALKLLDRAAVLLAFEQVGAASRALSITRTYTMERYAFGRPIASFQSLKHRMADRYCDIEIARSNAYYGAWALENESPELGVAACLARVGACQAFEQTTIDMIQLHGGVGFTWEFDCHLFYRRARLLSAMLGTAPVWKHRLIDRVAADEKIEAA